MKHFIIPKKLFISILALTLSQISLAQIHSFQWVKQMGGTGDDRGYSITINNSGNIYTTGYFNGTVDFDPGAGTTNLTSAGFADIFIQKLDASGNLVWVKQMGGTNYDQGLSITTDNSGNVYTTGTFIGTADFDPGIGTTSLTSVGHSDIFIQKLNASGNLIWAKQMGGNSYDYGLSITTDNSGNVYTTGRFKGTADFDPGAGTTNLTSAGDNDIFIQKLDASGNLLWVKQMGGNANAYGYSITIDNSGNVYTTGTFIGTVDFDPGTGTTNLTSVGWGDIFIQKLDASGNLLWVKQMGGIGAECGYSTTTDNNGNIYTTGFFQDTVDFDPGVGTTNLNCVGYNDIFIQKLDSLGNLLWVKQMGGNSRDEGYSITTDNIGNIYTTGIFSFTANFDPGAGTTNLTSAGYYDIFIQKLDSNGNLSWVKQIGGNDYDYVNSITIDNNGSVYTTGSFQGTADFDPDTGTTNLTSAGSLDIFILKLGQCTPSSGTDIITACNTYTWIDGNTYTTNNNTATHILTNAQGCDSVVTLNLTIDTVDVSLITTDPSILANATGASYQWLDCNNSYTIISGATAQSYTATANGDYAVEVTQNNCVDTSICVTISTVSISENPVFKSVSIYPNPTQDIVNINLGNLRDVSVKVFNVHNQLIYHKENINTPIYKFVLKEAPGVYFIELNAAGEKQQYKLIKGL